VTRRSKRASQNKRTRSSTHPLNERPMPRQYEDESGEEQIDYDEQDRNAASSERISDRIAEHNHEMLNDKESELEWCPYCEQIKCICVNFDDDDFDDTDEEETHYLDKRLSDREDFHSDESVGPIDIEPYYPEY